MMESPMPEENDESPHPDPDEDHADPDDSPYTDLDEEMQRLTSSNLPAPNTPNGQEAQRSTNRYHLTFAVVIAIVILILMTIVSSRQRHYYSINDSSSISIDTSTSDPRLVGNISNSSNDSTSISIDTSTTDPRIVGNVSYLPCETVESATTPSSKTVTATTTVHKRCSCFNSKAGAKCCQRAVLRAHKFGYILSQTLFKPFPLIERLHIEPGAFPEDPHRDYRHVVFTRNFFTSLVSGYLYHKSGRECWLTFSGWKRPPSWDEKGKNWDHYITITSNISYPPINQRSYCKYFADESEEDGMRVYIDMALSRWYGGVIPYMETVRERHATVKENRTMFVCLEDVSNPEKEEGMFYEMMDWLYPGGHNNTLPIPPPVGNYSGGHSTEYDPTERLRLLALVEHLDQNVFDNALARMDSLFGCSERR